MLVDLTKDERAELIDLLVGSIESAPFASSPRIQRLRSILAKIRTASPKAAATSAPAEGDRPSAVPAEETPYMTEAGRSDRSKSD